MAHFSIHVLLYASLRIGEDIWCNVTSVMAATPRRIASLRASIVRGLLLYTRPFSKPHKKKSGGVRSGDLGGHRFFEINWSPKYFQFPEYTHSPSVNPTRRNQVLSGLLILAATDFSKLIGHRNNFQFPEYTHSPSVNPTRRNQVVSGLVILAATDFSKLTGHRNNFQFPEYTALQ
jgi:hypothetical protein